MKRYFIQKSCTESWDAMAGDERERFCASCQRTVYDFSELTRREAERILNSQTGHSICGRISYGSEGVPVFRSELPGTIGQLVRISLLGLASLDAAAAASDKTCTLEVIPKDPAGAFLRSANVSILKDGETVAEGSVDDQSLYSAHLPAGHYAIQVSASGFSPYLRTDVNVSCSQEAPLQVVADMKVGFSVGEVILIDTNHSVFHRLKQKIRNGIVRLTRS